MCDDKAKFLHTSEHTNVLFDSFSATTIPKETEEI